MLILSTKASLEAVEQDSHWLEAVGQPANYLESPKVLSARLAC